ncbi:Domain of uncharacterised function (DUF2825) [Escherichia coli]|nr:Domain of uncharacterised function (DUF2825) [Escherichia coli]CAD5528992.1 Domain of uncharacterised function (DUF2825) [Escherichia coli]
MPQTQVYPRWRGEHCMALASSLTDAGLSPLARGTHISEQKTKPQPRFIPAGAGNTYKTRTHPPRGAVYPRWRGEHTPAALDLKKGRGLSPLARGTLHGYASSQRRSRFIPAGAGNTPRLFKRGRRGSVYPRWRGEHHKETILRFVQVGLSPLARGTLLQCQQSFPDCRFIPAGAGNTRRWHRQTPVLSVYPRWRGEHYRDRFWNLQRGGLSPLARGTQ